METNSTFISNFINKHRTTDNTFAPPLEISKLTRKTNMERKRHARMNSSIEELKYFLLREEQRVSSMKNVKLDKVEVLERIVAFLKQKKLSDYCAGFKQATNDVEVILDTTPSADERIRRRIMSHLVNCIKHLGTRSASVCNEQGMEFQITSCEWYRTSLQRAQGLSDGKLQNETAYWRPWK